MGHNDNRRALRGDQRPQPLADQFARELVVRYIATATNARPIRNNHPIASRGEIGRPSRTAVWCREEAGPRMTAAMDHHDTWLAAWLVRFEQIIEDALRRVTG